MMKSNYKPGTGVALAKKPSPSPAVMKPLLLLVAAALSGDLFAQAPVDVPELDSLKASWILAREQALRPIDSKYDAALKSLRDRMTKLGDLDAALAVDAEINAVFKAFLDGTSWKFDDGKIITLLHTGKVKKSWGVLEPEWNVSKGVLQFEGNHFVFNSDFMIMEGVGKTEFKGKALRIK